MVRGQSAFDAAQLQRELQRSDWREANCCESANNPPSYAAYREFYQLNFGHAEDHLMHVLAVDGERIVVQYYLPTQPHSYALICHGYYDHVGLYRHIINYLLSRNIGVIAFDQIGHGLSSGERGVINSFDQYVDAARAVLRHARHELNIVDDVNVHAVGQSMGGSIIMEWAHQYPQDLTGNIVLFAPLVRPYGWWLSRWLFAIAKLVVSDRPRTIMRNADNEEFMSLQYKDTLQAQVLPVAWVQAMVEWFARFEKYPPQSTLVPKIIQGYADRTVGWRHNIAVLKKRYPHSEWCIIPAASHHLANESDVIRAEIWQWLDHACDWSHHA